MEVMSVYVRRGADRGRQAVHMKRLRESRKPVPADSGHRDHRQDRHLQAGRDPTRFRFSRPLRSCGSTDFTKMLKEALRTSSYNVVQEWSAMKVTIHVVKHCKTMIPHLHLRIQNHTAFSLVYPCQKALKAKILKKVTKKSVQIASFCALALFALFCCFALWALWISWLLDYCIGYT